MNAKRQVSLFLQAVVAIVVGAATLLLITLILSCENANADTGCAYNPQNDGSWIRYQHLLCGGIWNGGTINIVWRYPDPQTSVYTITAHDILTPAYKTPVYQTDVSYDPSTTVASSLYDVVGFFDTQGWYFGEVGDPINGLLVTPLEPKLPWKPNGGEHLETDHKVSDCAIRGNPVFYTFHTNFWMVGHYQYWGPFQDCWRSTLVEYRPKGSLPSGQYQFWDQNNQLFISAIYNYVYARGIGLVDLWWGTPDMLGNVGTPNNPATELYAIAWGAQ